MVKIFHGRGDRHFFHKKKKRVFVNFFSSSREHLLIFINCVQKNASLSLQAVHARGKFYSMHRIPGLQYEFYFKNVCGVLAASPVYILSILLSLYVTPFYIMFVTTFHQILKKKFIAKIECGLYFLDYFDVLISKMIF